MPVETLEFLLLLSGWVVAFLLGRELQIGFREWRLRAAEQRTRRQESLRWAGTPAGSGPISAGVSSTVCSTPSSTSATGT